MAKRSKQPPRQSKPAPVPILQGTVSERVKIALQALLIVLATGWIYSPALHGDWLWDDNIYVTGNPLIHDPDALRKIWFSLGSLIEYYPIESTVRIAQWRLWLDNPFGYHVTNVVLHAFNALLVWRLLTKFKLRLAWLGGLLFAVHPAMVESVAWVSELKNTLSLSPFLLSAIFYMAYVERGRERDYFVALGMFLVAMLCKITMAMFPFVILLYVWWKRGRVSIKAALEPVPFALISFILGTVTMVAGVWYRILQVQAADVVPLGGFFSRLACAGLSLGFYFWNCVWPVDLVPIYPRWNVDPPSLIQFLPWPMLTGLLIWWGLNRKSWGRHVILGFGFFAINLAPFLGFRAISYMNFTWVMDHFLYIPIIGLIGLAVAGLDWVEGWLGATYRWRFIGWTTVMMAFLAGESHRYASYYINQGTLWSYTLEQNSMAWVANNNLGVYLVEHGDIEGGLEQFQQALKLNPGYAEARNNCGVALSSLGRMSEAMDQFKIALHLNPSSPQTQTMMGNAYLEANQVPESKEHYLEALRVNPAYAPAEYNLGNAFTKESKYPEAIIHYERALRLDSDYAEAHNNLGSALLKMGRMAEGMEHYRRAIAINDSYAEAHFNLGSALLKSGDVPGAMAELKTAIKLMPDYADAEAALGNGYLKLKQYTEAIAHYRAAVKIDPTFAEAHNNLGSALLMTGQLEEADAEYREALRLNPNNVAARKNLERLEGTGPR